MGRTGSNRRGAGALVGRILAFVERSLGWLRAPLRRFSSNSMAGCIPHHRRARQIDLSVVGSANDDSPAEISRTAAVFRLRLRRCGRWPVRRESQRSEADADDVMSEEVWVRAGLARRCLLWAWLVAAPFVAAGCRSCSGSR